VRFSSFVHRAETGIAGMLQWTNRQDVLDVFNAAAKKTLELPSDADDPGRSRFYRQVMGMLSHMNSAELRLKIYFAMCETFGQLVWTDEDRRLVEAAKAEALAIITKRNRIMHDVWAVLGENAVEVSDRPVPSLFASRTRSRATGPHVEQVTIEDLNADSDDLHRLMDVIGAILLVQFQTEPAGGESTPAYSTLFKFDSDGRVVRRDWPPWTTSRLTEPSGPRTAVRGRVRPVIGRAPSTVPARLRIRR
jgi:hypothetical protein